MSVYVRNVLDGQKFSCKVSFVAGFIDQYALPVNGVACSATLALFQALNAYFRANISMARNNKI